MTVLDNVVFELKIRKVSKSEINKRVEKVLEFVKLTDLKNRYSH